MQPNNQQAASANAISRRLASQPVYHQSVNPAAPAPTPAPQQTAAPMAPAAVPSASPGNPLSGGTGNGVLDSYLGTDSTYQTQLSGLMKQLSDYNAQRNLQASQTQADYDSKIKALNTQTAQDQLNMRNAAAARGILQSGIYANELGQYNDANQQQMTNLLGGLQNSKDTANLAYTQEVDNLEAAKQNAIQQAAARRAASLGTF